MESRFVLHGVPWSVYQGLCEVYEDRPGPRMTYCEGALELMSPGPKHEDAKTRFGRLIEAYADELGLPLAGYGSTTFRSEAQARGLEPDECYVLGDRDVTDRPDFAIEVIHTKPLLDKLDVYAGLGVPEVWVFTGGRLLIHELQGAAYVIVARSRFLPDIDVAGLVELVNSELRQWEAVRAWRERIRKR